MNSLQKKTVFISCFLLISGLMAIDFFNPSLPYILQDLQASQAEIKTLIVVYMGVLGLTQFIYGSYSDRIGRKKPTLISFGIACAGLLCSAIAQDINMLYAARALTAAGTAGCTVISRVIIVDVFSDTRLLKKAFSYFAMSSQISPAFAPLLGGFIQQSYGWRYSFVCLAIITLLSLLFLFKCMEETHFTKGNTREYLTAYELLIRDFKFVSYSLCSALVFVFTIGYYSVSPFAFHNLGYSPVQNSLFYLSYAAAILAGSWLMGSVLNSLPSRQLYVYTLLLYSAVFFSFFLLDFDQSPFLILLFSFLVGFTSGICAPLALVLSMSEIEINKGAASALQGGIKMFFSGIFMTLFDLMQIKKFSDILIVFVVLITILWGIYSADCFYATRNHKKV